MMLVWMRIGSSPVHGLGCFAEHDIQKGTKVWTFHPSIDMRTATAGLDQMPTAARRAWLQYGYVDRRDWTAALCGDDARFINHSKAPNIGGLPRDADSDFAFYDIPAGAELFCDYRLFGPGLCRSFLDPA